MANCKDCFHYEVCLLGVCVNGKTGTCLNFKNRNNIIELPFIAMVEQFLKDGKFDKKLTAHNGKIAVVYIDKSKWNSPLIDITEQHYNIDKAVERIQVLKEREGK